jgi:hypothetical protein
MKVDGEYIAFSMNETNGMELPSSSSGRRR